MRKIKLNDFPDENVFENEDTIDDKVKKRKTSKNEKVKSEKIRMTFIRRFDILNRFKHWYMGGISVTRSMFRVRAAWQGVIIICSVLAVLYILSAFYTGAGEFVISLDSTMSKDGFYLSNTTDFAEKMVCIRSNAVVADNISIFDISNDVDLVDGAHDGQNYVAHTFYLTNETGKTKDYQYKLSIRQSSKNAERALWVMVFYNGEQTIYAMNGDDGNPESQESIYTFPFEDTAAKEEQYQIISGSDIGLDSDEVYLAQELNRTNKLVAQPFVTDDLICEGVRKEINDKEVDKYTVVMWYEGEDPDCTDEIIGGWVEVYMGFDYLE